MLAPLYRIVSLVLRAGQKFLCWRDDKIEALRPTNISMMLS